MAIDPMTLSAGLSAGSSLLGGLFGSKSADKAAKAQQAAAAAAMEEQRRQYDTTRNDLSPWRRTGNQSIRQLSYLLGLGSPSQYNPALKDAQRAVSQAEQEYNALMEAAQAPAGGGQWVENWEEGGGTGDWQYQRTPGGQGGGGAPGGSRALDQARARLDEARNALNQTRNAPYDPGEGYGSLMRPFDVDDFEADPGYQFRLSQGADAIENSAAARGMQLSGANLKALNRFGQGFASNEYSNAWNRDAAEKDRSFNYLSGTSGQGLSAANATAGFGQQGANNISNLMTQSGNAQSAGIVGGANALQNGLTGAGNSLSDYMMMKTLLRSPGGGQLNPRGGY